MKVRLYILLLLAIGMGTVRAQVADSSFNRRVAIGSPVADSTHGKRVPAEAVAEEEEDEIVGSTSDLKFSENVPLAGSRALRQLEGVIVPNNKLSTHFAECNLVTGFEGLGVGFNYAYVPKRWGAYGSYVYDLYWRESWFSVGGEVRMVVEPSAMDWHLYAGPAYGMGHGLGYEIGTRLSLGQTENTSNFAWTSFSLGMMHFQDANYFMVGASVSISLLLFLILI